MTWVDGALGLLGLVDLLLAGILALRHSKGGFAGFIRFLRHPPAPPALVAFGDLVEILVYCWLLVVAVSFLLPGEPVLDGLSLIVTTAMLISSIAYLGCLLVEPERG
jgi:hypothetical protein